MNYVSAKEARKFLNCNPSTLMRYKNDGIIQTKRITRNKILYDIDSVIQMKESFTRKNVLYARVSCTSQKDDLDRQVEIIKGYMLSNGIKCDEVYKDIGSGMNEDRKQLQCLISEVCQNKIKTVYISYKDRLTRFGFDYLKSIFARFNTDIIILDELEETNKNFQDELTNDLISIIHHFSMKLYSNRRKKLKEIQKIIEAKED